MHGDNEELKQALHALLFGVRKSIRYHVKRRQFLDTLGRTITVLTLVSGVGTITTLLAKAGEIPTLVFASLVSFLAIVDVVIGTSEAARLHAGLARDFLALERDMVKAGENLDDNQVREFTAQRLEIEMEEPPIKRILDCMCHNELARAMGYGKDQYVALTCFQRWCAQFWDIGLSDIEKNCQIVS